MKTRKELQDEYKQLKPPMGVFQIRNTSNGKVLIDSSVDMKSRWNRHRMELKFGKHQNLALQNDWNEQGEENFVFEVLSEIEPKDGDKVDYPKELSTLQSMIAEDLNLDDDQVY